MENQEEKQDDILIVYGVTDHGGKAQTVTLTLKGEEYSVDLRAFEIKTLLIENGMAKEIYMTEDALINMEGK